MAIIVLTNVYTIDHMAIPPDILLCLCYYKYTIVMTPLPYLDTIIQEAQEVLHTLD